MDYVCSYMVANIFPTDTPEPGDGVNRSNLNIFFQNMAMFSYQFKGNHEMQQHGSKYFACRNPTSAPDLGIGSLSQNSSFFQNMVMFHISLKLIMNFINMLTNKMPTDLPQPWRCGLKVKFQLFFLKKT